MNHRRLLLGDPPALSEESLLALPLRILIERDCDLTCPADQDLAWKVYTWHDTNVITYVESEAVGVRFDNGQAIVSDPGLRRRLGRGLAHWLRCTRDGDYQLCSSNYQDGVLVWEHDPKELNPSVVRRTLDAVGFCKEYSDWNNGHGYGYIIQDADEEDRDSCWGFYGSQLEYMWEHIAEVVELHEYVIVRDDSDELGGIDLHAIYRSQQDARAARRSAADSDPGG